MPFSSEIISRLGELSAQMARRCCNKSPTNKFGPLAVSLYLSLVVRRHVKTRNIFHYRDTRISSRMSDLSGFSGSGFEANAGAKESSKGVDAELEGFLMMEKQKAQLTAQIHEFNDFCWEKCVDKPGIKLDSRTETCLTNCVDRFIDVSLLITNRFSQLLQKSAGGL